MRTHKFLRKLYEAAESETETGCWEWSGAVTGGGYGNLYLNGRYESAHRAAYEVMIGPIPEGLQIDHLCRNRLCINPSHLEPVTLVVNVMRGDGPIARNARKTHCRNGHPLSGDNLSFFRNRNGNVGRRCRQCARAAMRRAYQRDPEKFRERSRADRRKAAA